MPAARRPLPPHLTNRPFSVHEAAAAGIRRSRLRRDDLTAPFVGVGAVRPPMRPCAAARVVE